MPNSSKRTSRSRYADEPPKRKKRQAGPTSRRPSSVNPETPPRRPEARSDGRDIYSHSQHTHRGEPMVDIYSHSTQPKPQPKRRRSREDVRYYDGYTTNDTPPRPAKAARGATRRNPPARRRRKKRHIARRVVCVILVLLLILAVWMTVLFAQMDRTHNTDQSQYAAQPQNAPTWDIESNPLVTNILLIGMDQRDGESHGSDTMLLLTIDRLHLKLKMTSFLRDTYVEIPGHGMQKLNASFAYGGPALTMQTIENNYRIKVDKYLAVDFNTFAQLINAVGGIDVTLDEALCNEFYTGIGREYSPGEQNLTGVAALYYTRIRNVGNDYGRAERQREVVGQLVKKMALLGPIKLNEVLSEVMPQMWTNLSALEMTGLVFTSFPCVLFEQQSQQIPAENTYTSATVDVGAVLVPDLTQNAQILRDFLYGSGSPDA